MPVARHRLGVSTSALIAAALMVGLVSLPSRAAVTLRVPEDHSTIQSAINAASAGDVIDIAPGTYAENLTLNKSVTLRARIHDPVDLRNNSTILDGRGSTVVTIPSGLTPGPSLTGLVIRNGNDGISARSFYSVQSTYFLGSDDAIDNEGGARGYIGNNLFENPGDDAVDLDHPRDVTIEGNVMLGARQDGIEIRIHDDSIATRADVVIRDNEIRGSGQDGIQLIDYYQDTNRRFIIERNLILDNGRAGIGLLDKENSTEDYRAASIRERIHVFHNTLVGNNHGISGGDNLIALNNIFQSHALAVKNVDASSILGHQLFWNNTTDTQGSVVDQPTTVHADPLLDASYRPATGSPAIDAGTAFFEWGGEVVMNQPSSAFQGSAPDLGWFEGALPAPDPTPEPTPDPIPTLDATPPSVTTTSPADGATGVAQGAPVSVTFSEEMNRSSAETAFSLARASDGAAVAGSFSWSGTTMIFQPSVPLAADTLYTGRVGTAAQDPASLSLTNETTWSFRTRGEVTASPASTTVQAGTLLSGNATMLAADDNLYQEINSTTSSTRKTDWFGTFSAVPNQLASLNVTYSGNNSRSCTQRLYLRNWNTSSWVQLDSRTVGTTEVQVNKIPAGTLANYVSGSSGDGELRFRVQCTTTSGRFITRGDLMRIVYTALA